MLFDELMPSDCDVPVVVVLRPVEGLTLVPAVFAESLMVLVWVIQEGGLVPHSLIQSEPGSMACSVFCSVSQRNNNNNKLKDYSF